MSLTPLHLAMLLALTAVLGIATTRFSIFLSYRLGIFDEPSDRKAHGRRVAYLGGLGILLAFALGMAGLLSFVQELALLHNLIFFRVLGGAVAIFLVGFWDDIRPMPAATKLILQALVATAMWVSGVRVESISLGTQAGASIGPAISLLVTIGWYVVLMNAINLVDGLDGLAGGITLICAITLIIVSLLIGDAVEVIIGACISTLTAGAVFGFLVFNWPPAKTFMGDAGSLLLGYLLATASLISSTKTPTLLAIAVPIVALGLPLFETTFSFLRRAVSGQHPFKPDRRHLHHRLLDLGLDQRRVVIALLFFTAFLGLNSIIMVMAHSQMLLLNVLLLIAGVMILIENLRFLEKRRNGQSRTPPKDTQP